MSNLEVIKKPDCPVCHIPFQFDFGLPGNFWDPPEPPIWFCACGETKTPTPDEVVMMFRID